ncbi:hypothetical protein NMY22_g17071 [Coprinellus aureogranulatus]|nr:hypothetical protein NMY22_g17071 [Coprinellus aureogranulatus]
MLSSIRVLLRPLALHAAYTPIETIVFFTIIGTLAYFYILNAVKHSQFLSPSYNHGPGYSPTLRPAYVLNRMGEWVGVRESRWLRDRERVEKDGLAAAEVQQLVFNVDSLAWNGYSRDAQDASSIATSNLTEYLTHSFASTSGKSYPAICYRPAGAPKSKSSKAGIRTSPSPSSSVTPTPNSESQQAPPCFVHVNDNPLYYHHPVSPVSPSPSQAQAQLALALAFIPGSRDDWVNALKAANRFTDVNGVQFEVEQPTPGSDVNIGQMRSGKWVAYALRVLVMRFWALAKVRLSGFFHSHLHEKLTILTTGLSTTLSSSSCENNNNNTESRLPRHNARTRGLHPHAHHLLPPPHPFPAARVLILAPPRHPVFSDTGDATGAACGDGVGD